MKSNPKDELGEILHTYGSRFSIGSVFSLLLIPLVVAFRLIVALLMISILEVTLQEINFFPSEEEYNTFHYIFIIGIFLVLIGFPFRVASFPRWRKGTRIIIYQNGLWINDSQWKWEELSGVLKIVSPKNKPYTWHDEIFCQIYVNDKPVWGESINFRQGLRIVELIENRSKEVILRTLRKKYASGETLSFGNLTIHLDQIALNNKVFRTADCQLSVDHRRLVVQHQDGSARAVVRLLYRPNGHLIAPLLTGDESF